MQGSVIVGRLATGIGQGARFTRLDWAYRQFIDKLGIDPFPGTINIVVEPASLDLWAQLKATPGIRISNPETGPYACDARCYGVCIARQIPGAIVLPEVDGYAANVIEVISAKGVRAALGLQDGDAVRLEIV